MPLSTLAAPSAQSLSWLPASGRSQLDAAPAVASTLASDKPPTHGCATAKPPSARPRSRLAALPPSPLMPLLSTVSVTVVEGCCRYHH